MGFFKNRIEQIKKDAIDRLTTVTSENTNQQPQTQPMPRTPKRDVHADVAEQNRILSALNAAEDKFKQDNDIDALISVYEKEMVASPVNINSQKKALRLSELYARAGYKDKQWAYLNNLVISQRAPLYKVRLIQAMILKKDKKYLDSIEMYGLSYIAKGNWNQSFNEDHFIKDTKTCFKNLPDDALPYVTDLIKKLVKKPNYQENDFLKLYRDYLKSNNLI